MTSRRVGERCDERGAFGDDSVDTADEEVIRTRDHDDVRFVPYVGDLANAVGCAELVTFRDDQKLRARAATHCIHRVESVFAQGRCHRAPCGDPLVVDGQCGVGSERGATDDDRKAVDDLVERRDCRNDVEAFADTILEGAFRSSHPPEVETKGGNTRGGKRFDQLSGHHRSHVSTVSGMWVGEHSCHGRLIWRREFAFESQAVWSGDGQLFAEHVHKRYFREVPLQDPTQKIAIKMLSDRVLVQVPREGERTSRAGILIPATAQVAKRLSWAEAVAVGPLVRSVAPGNQVLFHMDEAFEVEVRGDEYLILRERDIHAVGDPREDDGGAGLYL